MAPAAGDDLIEFLLRCGGSRVTAGVRDEQDRYDFWISHSGKDQKWGEWVAWQLDQDGYRVLLDVWDFRPGASFVERMSHAVSRSDRLLLVLSSSYREATYVQPEWANFFRRDPVAHRNTIIPVRVEDVEAPPIIADLIWINLFGCSQDEARRRLLEGVRPDGGRPAAPPPFPAGPEPAFPSAVPALWRVPVLPEFPFSGRYDELENLDRLLHGQNRIVAVVGDSGVGKSRLVLEYLHRHKGEEPVVRWMRAGDRSSLTADYRRFALDLDLSVAGSTDDQAVVRAVVEWLDKKPGWLLVFDDVSQPNDLVSFLPHQPEGRVLVTSESRMWTTSDAYVVELEPLSTQEISGLLGDAAGDEKQHAVLAEIVRGLPLALEQVRGYLNVAHPVLAEYIDKIAAAASLEAHDGAESIGSVAATCEVTVADLRENDTVSSALLAELAYLAPDDIPLLLLRAETSAADRTDEIRDDGLEELSIDQLERSVERLLQLALVRVSRDAVSMHRSVQRQIRLSLTEEEQRAGWRLALNHVDMGLSYAHREPRYWQASQRLLPHALAVAEHIPQAHPASQQLGRVLHKAGVFLARSGRAQEALSLYERALGVARDIGDRQGEAATLNSMGHSAWQVGPWPQARQHFVSATKVYDELDSPDAKARTLNNLALVYWDEGRWAKAITEFGKSLAFQSEAEVRGGHKSRGSARANLGHVYWDQGRWADAIECYKHALRRQMRMGHLWGQARSLNCLALAYWDLGRWHDAAEAHADALEIFQQLGDLRAAVGTLNCLGFVLSHQGRWEEAVERHELACSVARDLRDNHLDAISQGDLGQAFATARRWPEALKHAESSMHLLRDADDKHGQQTAHNHIGAVLVHLDRTDEALNHHRQAIALAEEFGARHGEAVSLACVGRAYAIADDVSAARTELKKALHLFGQLGARHSEAVLLNELGLLGLRRRDLGLAERMFEASLAIRTQLGSLHGEAICLNNLAAVHVSRGIPGRALALLDQSLTLYRAMASRNGEASTLLNMATAYVDLDRPNRAADLERRAMSLTKLRDEKGAALPSYGLREMLSDLPIEGSGPGMVLTGDPRDRHGEPFALANLGLVSYTIGRWPPYSEQL
jgi:tetratricopeptide (TPR) repeat protein